MAEKTAEDKSKEEILVEVYSKKDQDFDLTVEALQDILLSDEFTTVHDGFLEQNYHHFEDTEENKHIYMDIYKAYVCPPNTPTMYVYIHTAYPWQLILCI
jgi:hypothetical protein